MLGYMLARRFFVILSALLLTVAPALAGNGRPNLNLIRDAEIETMLKSFATPVFQQAGIPPESVHFVLVQDSAINAFVAGGMNMFIYTGLLRAAKNPDELIGVVAHETGHIAGGHLVRADEAMKDASATAILATLAGLAAAVGSREGGAGAAAVALGQQVAQRNYLQYSRTQESSADQAALRFLDGAHISAQGMHDFLKRLEDQELLPDDQQVEFVRTHPLTRERVDAVAAHISSVPSDTPLPASYDQQFARMQAKLEGFLEPRETLQKVSPTDASFTARYARAIALHQTGDTQGALTALDALLAQEPKNPYLHEFKGQVLYESGHAAESVTPYREAVRLSGGNALLRVGLAQSLLETRQDSDLKIAVSQLEAALTQEKRSPMLWRLLATAYGRQNDLGMAAYALSEEAINRGDKPLAIQQAKRAQSMLPKGSPGWLRAGDVLASAETKDNKK